MLNSKKANITFMKIAQVTILVLVLFFIFLQIYNFYIFIKGDENQTGQIYQLKEKECDIDSRLIESEFKVCVDSNDIICNEKERKEWKDAESYLDNKNCENQECTCIQKIIFDLKNENLNDEFKSSAGGYTELSDEKINAYKNSENSYESILESFANENNLDVNILKAIILTEGAYDKNFEDTVRFECHQFNKYFGSKKVDCTCSNSNYCTNVGEDPFSRKSSETNYNAYLKAKDIDGELAFKSSSFGLGQIMGFNLDYSKYGDLDELKSLNTQTTIFLDYLKSRGLIDELQDKDWEGIARVYNGAAYKNNQYDTKLKKYYEILIS